MIVGVVGHVDHGKTSLVRALTGIETDRLKEERARGITIEPGFAHWRTPGGDAVSFVDMPGHERFIGAMLAGAAAVDAVLLVVAADDGVMPQTVEHLAVARLLGVRRGIVALSKADRVDAAGLARAAAGVTQALARTPLAGLATIPVSSASGQGIDSLAEALAALARAPGGPPAMARNFRLSVDRIFSVAGSGTVVAGTVRAGQVAAGDRLLLQPSGRAVRVRGLARAGGSVAQGAAGDRLALNLAGVAVDEVARGDVLAAPEDAAPVAVFDAAVTGLAPGWPPERGAADLRLHLGWRETGARLVPLARLPDGRTLARIVAATPVPLLAGERVVLRNAAGRRVVGGAEALDLAPPPRGRSRPERVAALVAMLPDDPVRRLRALLEHPPHAVPRAVFAGRLGLPASTLPTIEKEAGATALASVGDPLLVGAGVGLRLRREIVALLDAFHAREPELPGLSPERLRARLGGGLASATLAALLDDMRRRGELAGNPAFAALPGHAPRLSPAHEALWGRLRPRLDGERRLRAPTVAEHATDLRERPEALRGLLKRLARRGDVIEVADDRFFLAAAVAEMADGVRETGGRWFDAAAFRDRLGGGRKMAILALEFFDRRGLTIRDGDRRRLNPQRAGLFRREHAAAPTVLPTPPPAGNPEG
jgi:selenocysteine-specific elongation factor